jgi:uncharacterized protein YegP (UPF0339 family)
MGTFQIFRDRRKEYRWRLRADNNRVIADSGEGYHHKSDCKHGMDLVRGTPEVEIFQDLRGAYRWHMRAANRRIIADSGEGYTRKFSCKRAIETVRRIAQDADLDDRTVAGAQQRARMAPIAEFSVQRGTGASPLAIQLDGNASADLDGTIVGFAWDFGDGAGGDGATIDHTYPAPGCFPVALTIMDDRGVTRTIEQLIDIGAQIGAVSIVPWEDPNGFDLAPATDFLFAGPDPIQFGVAMGAIDPRRAAIIHGRVYADDGQPIEGAMISVLGHPEFGRTTSRDDGGFDLAVNGGGPLVMHFEISGRLDVETAVYPRWQEDAFVPDVVIADIS